MDLEFHQLDRRYESLRRKQPEHERDLLASLAGRGQQVPIVVVALKQEQPTEARRFLVIDGFKRLRCLKRLGADTACATLWDLQENEALLLDRSQRDSERLTQLELGWLLATLRDQGLDQQELAKRFDKDSSWVSRHLALVEDLPLPIQEYVRRGAIPAHAAMRHLVPIARKHKKDCLRLARAIADLKLTSREIGELCSAWLDGSSQIRERLLDDPRLFLRARARRQEPEPVPAALELLRQVDQLAQSARRLRKRFGETDLVPQEITELHAALHQAQAELETFDKEIDRAGQEPSTGDSETCREGNREAAHRQASQDLPQHRGDGDQVADGDATEDPPASERRAPSRGDHGAVRDMPGQSRAGSRGASSSGQRSLILRLDRLLPPARDRDEAEAASGEIPLRAGPGDAARHLAPQG
jgi:ParB family chromosome partitioning protein